MGWNNQSVCHTFPEFPCRLGTLIFFIYCVIFISYFEKFYSCFPQKSSLTDFFMYSTNALLVTCIFSNFHPRFRLSFHSHRCSYPWNGLFMFSYFIILRNISRAIGSLSKKRLTLARIFKSLPWKFTLAVSEFQILWKFYLLAKFLWRVKNKNPNLFFFHLWTTRIPSRLFLFVSSKRLPFFPLWTWTILSEIRWHSFWLLYFVLSVCFCSNRIYAVLVICLFHTITVRSSYDSSIALYDSDYIGFYINFRTF